MADQENLELDEVLEKITFYCFDEARKKIEAGEECVPFTCVVSGEQMFVEGYPGEDVTMCRKNAEANVKSSSSFSSCYAFCYDGFLMTDEGQLDAILVECAQRDMESPTSLGCCTRKKATSCSLPRRRRLSRRARRFTMLPRFRLRRSKSACSGQTPTRCLQPKRQSIATST